MGDDAQEWTEKEEQLFRDGYKDGEAAGRIHGLEEAAVLCELVAKEIAKFHSTMPSGALECAKVIRYRVGERKGGRFNA